MDEKLKETHNELSELADKLLNNDSERIRKDIERIYTDLIVNKTKPILPEDVFKRHFLDYFRNSNKEEYKDSILLNKWLEVAGSPYTEVTIIDNKGEKLFDVPAIYNNQTVNTDILKEKGVSFNRIVKDYVVKKDTNPLVAEAGMNTDMSGLPKCINNIENDLDTQGRWIKIFKRYENEETIEDKMFVSEENVPQSVKEDLGLIYDQDVDYDEEDARPLS